MIGTAMVLAGGSGLIGTGKEMFASAQAILAGVKDHPGSALIKEIAPDPAGDRQAAIDQARKQRDWAMARLKEKGINSPDKLRAQAIEDARAVAALLAAKSSEPESTEYKKWAMSVAEKVAMAASEGGFLGFGGERFSVEEKKLLNELQAALEGKPTA
jgi:hypothetical protein